MRTDRARCQWMVQVWNTPVRRAGGGLLSLCLIIVLASAARAQVKEFGPDVRKTEDGISYVTTGVGKDSRDNLPQFPLKLVFSTRTARYLANIETEIAPVSGGKSTRIQSIGPWLLVDLPPGKYRVKARTTKGQEVSKSFQITKGQVTSVNLIWNISDEDI